MAKYRYITLGEGSKTKVDSNDYKYLSRWKWQNVGGYATRVEYPAGLKGTGYRVLMHRVIVACPEKLQVDHKNHDPLDNTRENLRVATRSQNQWNKVLQKNNTSGHKGIVWDKANRKWRATINMKDKFIHIGRYESLDDAVSARKERVLRLHGEFAEVGNG